MPDFTDQVHVIVDDGEAVHAETNSNALASIAGHNLNTTVDAMGAGVFGRSEVAEGVHGETKSEKSAGVAGVSLRPHRPGHYGEVAGPGVFGKSELGEGVHGETNSPRFAGVAGVSLNPIEYEGALSAGVFGRSAVGEGVHGDTDSAFAAGVSGHNRNATGSGAGVFGRSEAGEGMHGETASDKFAAVAGLSLASSPAPGMNPAGVFGKAEAGEGVHGETNSEIFAGIAGHNMNPAATGAGVYGWAEGGEGVHGGTNSAGFAAVAGFALNPAGTGAGVFGESRGNGAGVFGRGKVAGAFEGDVRVDGKIWATVDVCVEGADCAEEFDVVGSGADPGSVMVIDDSGAARLSDRPYDTRVVGVVSGASSFKPGLIMDFKGDDEQRQPLALIGKVFCKVDATFAPIDIGDLLSTSSTPGHAMKATDRSKAFGSIIGKALQPLARGRGLVSVLVALQ